MTKKNFDDLVFINDEMPVRMPGKTAEDEPVQASFGMLITRALETRYPDDDKASLGDLYRRGKLADKIDRGGDVDLQSDEQELIKIYAGRAWPPRVVTRICDKVDADYTPKGE